MTDDMPTGAVAVTSNLDLLTDEPLELVIALRKLADSKKAERGDWAQVWQTMNQLVFDLQALNEPPTAA